jgi:hypothetical protein
VFFGKENNKFTEITDLTSTVDTIEKNYQEIHIRYSVCTVELNGTIRTFEFSNLKNLRQDIIKEFNWPDDKFELIK